MRACVRARQEHGTRGDILFMVVFTAMWMFILSGLVLLWIPAAASDISLEVVMRLFPRACIWRDLLHMLLETKIELRTM